MKPDNKAGGPWLYALGLIPAVWLALLIAPSLSGGLSEILEALPAAMNHPFQIVWCEDSIKAVLIFIAAYGLGIGIYLSSRRNYRRGEEHGSAKWGDPRAVNKKYRDKDPFQNRIFTQHVRMGLDGKKHRRTLNTLVCGGSGAGKSRFYAKVNICQANTSFFILDCKGELLRDCGGLLERQGYEVTWLQPDQQGIITAEQVEAALRPDTILVAMMLVNNELGTVLPVAETARAIRAARCPALLHCDAVQGFLKVPFTPEGLGVDTLAVSGHKVHAPKGIGALYIRRGLRLPPLIRGGGQEEGLRSGTEPTAQTAAFAAAVEAGRASLERDLAHMRELKDYAARTLREQVPGLELIGAGTAPHILPVTLTGYKSEVVVRFLSDQGIYLSSGSACHKGKPSHVYAALKLPKPQLDGILRISFSYDTAREDVDALVQGLKEAQAQLFTSLS